MIHPTQWTEEGTTLTLLEDLEALLTPEQVTVNQTLREHHSHDESYHEPRLPDVVVFPESARDVAAILRYADQNGIPVVPFALGSSLEGHSIPAQGGISLDMMRMNRILEIRPDDFLVKVQPGVSKQQINDALRRHGLFFSVDPGSNPSVGGMASTNAGGTTTVRYGSMRDQVRALEVVLPDGSIIHTGSLAAKSSSGYHLTGLFVGSEGTLGVFTELWLRVHGLPETVLAARASFPDAGRCVRAATAIMGAGIPVARLEFMDSAMIRAVNRFQSASYPEIPTLFLEFHGNHAGVHRDVENVRELAADEDCASFAFAESEEDRHSLWDARHVAATAFLAGCPGKRNLSTDVCLPLSELPDAMEHANRVLAESGLQGGIVGHLGDGNYHVLLAVNPDNPDDMRRATDANERIVRHSLERGGTCTGEHGVGIGKRRFQEWEHGPALQWMRAVKRLFDPNHIMNPGKLVDE